jgi:hypothetical protein
VLRSLGIKKWPVLQLYHVSSQSTLLSVIAKTFRNRWSCAGTILDYMMHSSPHLHWWCSWFKTMSCGACCMIMWQSVDVSPENLLTSNFQWMFCMSVWGFCLKLLQLLHNFCWARPLTRILTPGLGQVMVKWGRNFSKKMYIFATARMCLLFWIFVSWPGPRQAHNVT